MKPSDPTPNLPKWIFLLTDAVLLSAAWYLATRSANPLAPTTVIAVVACVLLGALIATVPFIVHYEQKKNEMLDDRQRALEALARTVAASAEQISIAAQGLHEIAELAQKNLRSAEQLPHKLQEKIAEFQSQLANAREDDREEMEKELATLRTSESDRLEATADKVHKAAAELAKLEAAAQKHLTAFQAGLAQAPEAISTATAAALAEIDAQFAARTAAVVAALEAAEVRRPRKPKPGEPAPASAEAAAPTEPAVTPTAEAAPAASIEVGVQIQPVVPPTAAPFTDNISTDEPPPTTSASIETGVQIQPIAPPTAAPFSGHITTEPPTEAAPASEPKLPKKRAPRKPKAVEPAASGESALNLGIEPAAAPAGEFDQTPPAESKGGSAEVVEKVISSDGATRLLVTAYIGIGNRLFIRGEGPGLTWEKGVPLQFVSIGKWRWETAEAAAPVKFKLYKNDETECTALGSQALEPGHQEEVNATF